MIALAFEAAKFGGAYASHIRDEGDAIIPGAGRSVPHRARGENSRRDLAFEGFRKSNWGRMPEIVAHIEAARKSGLDVGGGHLRVSGGVQQFLGGDPTLGARWR